MTWNAELIDNGLQVAVLGCAAIAAALLALRRRSRAFLTLACGYGCFLMGTLFYVLHLAIIGYVPQIFYVSEISWLGAYLSFLSLCLARSGGTLRPFSLPGLLCALPVMAAISVLRIFGPALPLSTAFALTGGAIAYLSVGGLVRCRREGRSLRRMDVHMAAAVPLQVVLYGVSALTKDYGRFNWYYAVDILLTLNLVAMLPALVREEGGA